MNKLALATSQALKKPQGQYQRITASAFSRRPFIIVPEGPIISFTFDDFPRSALLTGRRHSAILWAGRNLLCIAWPDGTPSADRTHLFA